MTKRFCAFCSPLFLSFSTKKITVWSQEGCSKWFSMKRCDNEIDNRSFGKSRVGFGVSTFQLKQQQQQLVEIFKPMNFPYPLYFIRIRDRGSDEWHGRGEEARETRRRRYRVVQRQNGCTSRRSSQTRNRKGDEWKSWSTIYAQEYLI